MMEMCSYMFKNLEILYYRRYLQQKASRMPLLDMNRPAASPRGCPLCGWLGRELIESGTLDSWLSQCFPQQIRLWYR